MNDKKKIVEQKKILVAMRLPFEFHKQIKKRALENNMNMSAWVVMAAIERMGREDAAK